MSAIEVARDLDFIDGQELHGTIKRHRLHRADEITRGLGRYLFFAGDQRREPFALGRDDAVIHLPRQQPER